MTRKLIWFLFAGFFILSTGFYLGQTTQNKIPQKLPSVTPIQVQSPIIVQPSVSSSVLGENSEQKFKVLKVIDGDTIDVEINGKRETIRLIGIDAPETSDPRKPVQCFGREAAQKAKEILTGKFVRLENDETQGERDKYKRLLRYVFLEDKTNFNKLMISDGFAFEYTYKTSYKYQNEFKAAEKVASENKRGLWADNACSSPVTSSIQPIKIQSVDKSINSSNSSFSCNCSKTCSQILSCEEAYFQLNQCGCSKRDADGDGTPCESLC